MFSIKNSLLLIALSALGACASRPPPVVYQPVQVPPLPVEIGQKREANLTDRLTNLLTPSAKPSPQSPPSSPKATEPLTSSTPASTPTTK